MIVFPNCKINLGLSVINKRSDGFHNLETIFYPIALNDALEIIPSLHQTPSDAGHFSLSGLPVTGSQMDNLCLKAYHLLKLHHPLLPSINMHLHKTIPMGAGLGGGSADGAFVLTLLNKMFNLGLPTAELLRYAAMLGSDCPFFVENKPCFASGRGEILEPISLDLSGYMFLLVDCGIPINTGWAFSQISLEISSSPGNLKEIVTLPIASWRNKLVNDFERPVFLSYPAIQLIKEQLYDHGALYASMTGSGSTVYGIFEKSAKVAIDFPVEYRMFEVEV